MKAKKISEILFSTNIHGVKDCLINIPKDYLDKLNGNLYEISIFLLSILNKSYNLLDGIENAINTGNKVSAEILLRSLYENLIITSYIFMNPNGKQVLDTFKDGKGFFVNNNGKKKKVNYTKMDTFLREEFLAKDASFKNKFDNVYKYGCEYVHFSLQSIKDTFTINGKNGFGMVIGKTKWNDNEILTTKNISINIGNCLIFIVQLIILHIEPEKRRI